MLDLRVWPGQVADGSIPSATPGKGPKDSNLYRLNKVGWKISYSQQVKFSYYFYNIYFLAIIVSI